MSTRCASAIIFAGLMSLCARSQQESAADRQRDANTPAGKAGQVARKVAVEAGKAGRVVGRKLDKAAHDAREGWKEAARKDANNR